MKNITEGSIVVHYDEVTLHVDYELYESENHRRISFRAKPTGLAEQAVLNAIEEHLKMKKNKDGRIKTSFEHKGGASSKKSPKPSLVHYIGLI